MASSTQELFVLAAKFFLKKNKEKIGPQKDLAKELDITQAYLSSVLNGSRPASLDLYAEIAEKLYGPLDKFLAIGRRIKENREPFVDTQENLENDDVEHLIARLTYYIMDHKRIEREINELKHFYESIVENLQSAVLVMNRKNEVIFANQRIKDLCGINQREIIGTKLLNIEKSVHGLQIYPFVQKYIEASDLLKPLFFENIPVVTPLGESHYNSGWLIPILKDDAFDGMICTIRDTSDSHALFHLLTETIEQIPEAIVIVQQKAAGEKPFAFFANKQFRKILGLDDIDSFSHSFEELIKSIKKNVKNKDEWEQFILHSIKNNTVNAAFIIEHSNGKKFAVTGNPISDNHGLHIGRTALLEEIR